MSTVDTATAHANGQTKSAEVGRPVQQAMRRLDEGLARIENIVILTSYSTLVLLVGVETLRRAITQQQAVWGPEIALYAFVWLSWFSMARHCRYGTHLAFVELRSQLPMVAQRALEAFDCLLWLVLGGIIVVTSYGVVANSIHMNQVVFGTHIPLAVASLAVPIGWGFSMVRILQRLWTVVFSRDLHREPGAAFIM
jgi:TRAP-type C4-dicarboxylate transport system permease small subunit